ncbi:MAG: DUF805 domain-containing protein [Lachnospiraceae bacterium]
MGISKFWSRLFDFKGKSTRREFWPGYLVNLVIYGVVGTLLSRLLEEMNRYDSPPIFIILAVYSILLIIGDISAIIRRLRDAGIHPAVLLLLFFPVGNIAVIVCLFLPTKTTEKAVIGEADRADTVGEQI